MRIQRKMMAAAAVAFAAATCVVGVSQPASAMSSAASDAVVPEVVGASRQAAIDAVQSRGLVPNLQSQALCIDPQAVLSQSPLAGTHVSRGATVTIHYDSSTLSGCGGVIR